MSTPPRPSKGQRRDDARATALRLREEQQRVTRRQRTVAIAALVGGLAVVAVLVVVILGQAKRSPLEDVASPQGSTVTGGIPVDGDGAAGVEAPDGALVVSVYSDYMCPVCKAFEQVNAATLTEYAGRDGVSVQYHPISILDRSSQGTSYSTRAANAAAVVADADPDHFVAFHQALFANQPQENTPGLSDEQIAQVAADVGVPQDVVDTFGGLDASGAVAGPFTQWIAAATDKASKDGVGGTPTIMINGKPLDLDTYDWRQEGRLAAAIDDALG